MEEKRVIKDHPAQHPFQLQGDIVIQGSADRPRIIDRHLKCQICPMVRVDTIDVARWVLVGRQYKKDKDTVIEYATPEQNLRARFLAMLSGSDLTNDAKNYLLSRP